MDFITYIQDLHTQSFGWTLYFFPVIDSTNTRLKALARQGAEAGTVVWAGVQYRG
ncbi:MAG: biotin--[acetyl-CoA-carboxylase] ligase, partial [Nitrospinota bacterium]